jgi:hypothetical protein
MSGIPAWVRPGVKVVCVDADDSLGRFAAPDNRLDMWDSSLTERAVYTIDRVARHGLYPDLPCIHVREVARPSHSPFAIRRFRPLVDDEAQERDAAMFRKLLTQNTPELVE